MCRRKNPLHLVVDGLPAHKKAAVKKYVAGMDGRLTLHFLSGYAPDLNPDELVWSQVYGCSQKAADERRRNAGSCARTIAKSRQ